MNSLYEKISDEGDDKTWRGGMEMLAKLHEKPSMSLFDEK